MIRFAAFKRERKRERERERGYEKDRLLVVSLDNLGLSLIINRFCEQDWCVWSMLEYSEKLDDGRFFRKLEDLWKDYARAKATIFLSFFWS
jgi:hypothetical protein